MRRFWTISDVGFYMFCTFSRILLFSLLCFPLFGAEHVFLKTPDISPQNIIGSTVGIRPYRKTGIRLEAETIRDKLIIHNYGYGGSGLTLAFGGSNEVLEILNSKNHPSKTVAVLGAGVAGLTTAYDFLEKGYEVHIYSDHWNPDLTSNVAAGAWTPLLFPKDLSLEKKLFHEKLLQIAEERFLKSTEFYPEFEGVKLLCYYGLKSQNQTQESDLTENENEVVIHFDNGTTKYGQRFYRLAIDGQLFMKDLYAKVKSRGAILHQKRLENLEEVLNLKESIIINCTSFGSRELFDDKEFIPIRGQMAYFPAQDIDYVLYQSIPNSNYFFFLYPWSDRIILGGIYEYGEEESVINPQVIDEMIQNGEKCLSK